MIAYLIIFTTAVAALLSAPLWTVLIGALLLAGTTAVEQRKLMIRSHNTGTGQLLAMAAWQTAGHALLASSAAYALGYIARFTI